MAEGGGGKDPGKRLSESFDATPTKGARCSQDEDEQSLPSPGAKQITLASALRRSGSDYEIKKVTSPGAKKRPTLLEILSKQVADDAENIPEAQEKMQAHLAPKLESQGEDEEIKNGLRDRCTSW